MDLHKPMIVAKQATTIPPPFWQKESVGKDIPLKQDFKDMNPYFRKNNNPRQSESSRTFIISPKRIDTKPSANKSYEYQRQNKYSQDSGGSKHNN